MNLEKIALFDMDGTLVDYDKPLRRRLMEVMPPEYAGNLPEDLHAHNLPQWMKDLKDMIQRQENWWRDLPPYIPGWQILEQAIEIGFDIHILTKGPSSKPNAWKEKLEWCRMHLDDDIKITVTEDKSLVYGRVLVDDFPEYMENWLANRPRGLGIMPKYCFNENFKHENVISYDGTNIGKIRTVLQSAFDREPRGDLNI